MRGRRAAGVATLVVLLTSGCEDGAGPPYVGGDPTPTADRAVLAERFAPVIWLAGGDPYGPGDATKTAEKAELWFHQVCEGAQDSPQVAAEVEAERLGSRAVYQAKPCGHTTASLPADQDVDAGPGGKGFYLDLDDDSRRGDGADAPVYWQSYEDGDRTAIVYWLFYPYNDFINNHEGDWERVAVQLRGNEPIGVTFWKHEEPTCLVPWDDLEKDATRPVTYAAAGSHGSYHRAGGFDAVPGPSQVVTDITSRGTRWDTRGKTRPITDEPWWGYRGKWGTQPGLPGTDGPRGPYPGRELPVFATEPCTDPLPPPTATAGPSPSVPEQFTGTWRSPKPVDQPGYHNVYHVEMTIHAPQGDRVGDVHYPGLGCRGTLRLVTAKPDELVIAERIEHQEPATPCVVEGRIRLTLTPTGLRWVYNATSEASSTATADLVRS